MSSVEVIPEVGASPRDGRAATSVARCATCRRSWLLVAEPHAAVAAERGRRAGAHAAEAPVRFAPEVVLPAGIVTVLLGLLLLTLLLHVRSEGAAGVDDGAGPAAVWTGSASVATP